MLQSILLNIADNWKVMGPNSGWRDLSCAIQFAGNKIDLLHAVDFIARIDALF